MLTVYNVLLTCKSSSRYSQALTTALFEEKRHFVTQALFAILSLNIIGIKLLKAIRIIKVESLFITYCYCLSVEMQVVVNTQPVLIIRLQGLVIENCITRSRAAIVQLNVGDKVYVTVPTVGCYFENTNYFAGLRLF